MIETMRKLVSPKDAAEYLRNNTSNRPIRPSLVKDYARQMRNGLWGETHQGIAISYENVMLDGQHRLMAIIEADMAVMLQITTGLSPDAFKLIDKHGKRTNADSLHLSGRVTEPCNFIAKLHLGYVPAAVELDQFVSTYADTINRMVGGTAARRIYSSAPMVSAACITAIRDSNMDYVRGQYIALLHSDYDDMTDVSKSFSKQVSMTNINAIGSSGRDIFCRAMIVFDKKKKNNTKLLVKDISFSISEAKLLIAQQIGDIK